VNEALREDILAVLPFGSDYLSVDAITAAVAPRRGREVRATLNALAKSHVLDLNRGGGGWVALYGRKPITRRI
jgi:hypothetical protein